MNSEPEPTTLDQALNVIEMLAAHIHTMLVQPQSITMATKATTEELARSSVVFVRAVRHDARSGNTPMTTGDVCRIFDVPEHLVEKTQP